MQPDPSEIQKLTERVEALEKSEKGKWPLIIGAMILLALIAWLK
jgi:hypothetical protein